MCSHARLGGALALTLRLGGAAAESEGEVTKTGPHPTGRQWTDADDAQLLALLESKMDRIVIARRLKRTVLAIGQRKSVLKKRLVEIGLKAKK